MPENFVLDPADLRSIGAHLHALGWLLSEEIVAAARAGDGNMNMTVRLHTNRSSYILKQARPWVVKYPQIPAPLERASVESGFYRHVTQVAGVGSRMPRLLGFDAGASLLCLEDLGEMGDLTSLYQRGPMPPEQCAELTDFLFRLHGATPPPPSAVLFQNLAMRRLNHEHQYDLPLRPGNGIDLDRITPGLAAIAEDLKADPAYCGRIAELGRRYLADGPVLVHGDFFPGSWLPTASGVRVIDPEFCHLGDREYDLGVFLAHLELTHSRALWRTVEEGYRDSVDWALARRFAGAEIMRRLIGVAQLPVTANLETKRFWLETSRALVCVE